VLCACLAALCRHVGRLVVGSDRDTVGRAGRQIRPRVARGCCRGKLHAIGIEAVATMPDPPVSVDAPQEILIWFEATTSVLSPAGADGAVLSVLAEVFLVVLFE